MEKIFTDADGIRFKYTNVEYHGLSDTYVFCGMQEVGGCLYMPLYNGVEHNNTLSMKTIEDLIGDKE